ncbi:MAG: GTP 3',8-cyclase MoaA [Chiayiivirga sp.]|jgi:cyclic pyranopterin phosphate synthase|nr:GTP 3',8-cyclase MoaA [Chiayiivirga sp.]
MARPIHSLLVSVPTLDRLQRPLRDLRISVIETCNFRCPYCMPEDRYPQDEIGDRAGRLDFDEIERVARAFAQAGVRKLRLTGGEPLLRRGLPELVARLVRIEGIEDLALTTNGSLLARHARALREAGLQRLTISLDTLDPERFHQLSGGRGELRDVLDGIAAAEQAGFGSIKFNCVVQRGENEDDVLALVERFRGTGHVVRFIEYMDVGTCNGWRAEQVVPSAQLRERIASRWPVHALDAGYRGEVAERFAFDDGAGEVGFVSSVSTPFCGDCHRARLSADGKLYTCLFAASGHDLRGMLRDGADEPALVAEIERLWSRRGDRYSELRSQLGAGDSPGHVEMYAIGG